MPSVQDGSHPANNPVISIGQPVVRLAVFKSGILIPPQGVEFVKLERRNPIRITAVHFEGKMDERF
jgi:hypothetical protein